MPMGLAAVPDSPVPLANRAIGHGVGRGRRERGTRRLVRYLHHDGFDTLEAADGVTARRRLKPSPGSGRSRHHAPRCNGLDLCRWIRAEGNLPVILLTARGEESDRITGLELGADDYVVKPFSPRELVVRIKSILRRSPAEKRTVRHIEAGGLSIDADRREVLRGQGRRPHRYRVRSVVVPGQAPPCCVLAGAVVGAGLGIRGGARRRYGHRHSPRPPPAREDRGRSIVSAAPQHSVGLWLPVHTVIGEALILVGPRWLSGWCLRCCYADCRLSACS